MKSHPDPDHAEAAFYRAFAHCDLHGMTQVWEATPEASCIHPGGPLLQGSEAVLHSWEEIFSQARPPAIDYRVLQRLQDQRLVIHTVEESIRPSDGDDAPTRLVATNIYLRGSDGWRMLAHHASLPMLGQHRAAAGPVH
jgi:ketosteroid isomerase-like protein